MLITKKNVDQNDQVVGTTHPSLQPMSFINRTPTESLGGPNRTERRPSTFPADVDAAAVVDEDESS